MVDHRRAEIDPVRQLRMVLGKLVEQVFMALADSRQPAMCHVAVQRRQYGVFRIAGEEGVDILIIVRVQLLLDQFGRNAHRSISPNTISSVPRTADTSARDRKSTRL